MKKHLVYILSILSISASADDRRFMQPEGTWQQYCVETNWNIQDQTLTTHCDKSVNSTQKKLKTLNYGRKCAKDSKVNFDTTTSELYCETFKRNQHDNHNTINIINIIQTPSK
jgi:hypothetical protein